MPANLFDGSQTMNSYRRTDGHPRST